MKYAIFNYRTQTLLKSRFQLNSAGKIRARIKVDKLDNIYGAYAHSIIIIKEDGDFETIQF